MPFLINKYSIGSLVRSIGFFDFSFLVSGIIYPSIIFLTIYFGDKIYDFEIYSILLVYLITDFFVYIALSIKYFLNKSIIEDLIIDTSRTENLIELKNSN